MLAAAQAKGMALLLPSDVLVSGSLDEPIAAHVEVLTSSCCDDVRPCIPAGKRHQHTIMLAWI